ncbi:MAG: hypothetical protein ACLRPX_05740 [Ruthenibacterium sp.]
MAIGRALAAVPGVGDAVFVQRLQACWPPGRCAWCSPAQTATFTGPCWPCRTKQLRAGA